MNPFFPFPANDLAPLEPKAGIRVAQFIWVSLIMGLLMFAGVALNTFNAAPAQPQPPMIGYVAAGFAGMSVLARIIAPGIVSKLQMKGIKDVPPSEIEGRLFIVFQTKMIVALAVLEGASFLNLFAFMLEKQWFSLGVAGFLLLLMMMCLPTLHQFESWAEDMKRDLS